MTTDAKGPDETFGMALAMKQTMDLILEDRPVDLDKLHDGEPSRPYPTL